ncbi:protein LDOC1-like [Pleurodeles waltl]|uniref:protein LDOC1-like n=1 Tax=Pleurodeles waltl TaxID=8319 RepID=UPI003709BBF4
MALENKNETMVQDVVLLRANHTRLMNRMIEAESMLPQVQLGNQDHAAQIQALEKEIVSSDKAKVGYLISALSGPALAWATPLVSAEDPVLSNYPAFLTIFKQMFERPGVEAAAEEALCDIQQGNQDVL